MGPGHQGLSGCDENFGFTLPEATGVFEQEADEVPLNILTMMALAAMKRTDRKKQQYKQEAYSKALQRCRGRLWYLTLGWKLWRQRTVI